MFSFWSVPLRTSVTWIQVLGSSHKQFHHMIREYRDFRKGRWRGFKAMERHLCSSFERHFCRPPSSKFYSCQQLHASDAGVWKTMQHEALCCEITREISNLKYFLTVILFWSLPLAGHSLKCICPCLSRLKLPCLHLTHLQRYMQVIANILLLLFLLSFGWGTVRLKVSFFHT